MDRHVILVILFNHAPADINVLDQICINQSDNAERSIQVGLMSKVYTKASRVIIWLGVEDEHSRLCKKWLEALDSMIPTLKGANRITIGSPEYNPDWRGVAIADTFNSPDTSPQWAPAIMRFWSRSWFRRGWIVQEFLLARDLVCLTGDMEFSLQNLIDMFRMPHKSSEELFELTERSFAFQILMTLKTDPFTDTPQPLRFLRIMAAGGEEFITKELGDRLYGFLGMLPGLDFVPDYAKPLRDEFTRLAVTLARQYGSLDFLSMWSANIDEMLKDTPPELLGLPSWVPSFSATPLTVPWRLAVGGTRTWRSTINWNASAGCKHIHDQTEDACITRRLHVRGRIVDYIDEMSTARMLEVQNTDEAYRTSIVDQIKSDLPAFAHWTQIDMVQFLINVSRNGQPPIETAEQVLGLAPNNSPEVHRVLRHNNDVLGCCLSMARGRRFMTTHHGRKGLAPFIGSFPRKGDSKGSAIVLLHGCIVPVVLVRVEDGDDVSDEGAEEESEEGGRWKIVGDTYVEGLMMGEGVTWDEKDARRFVLV